MRTLIAAAFVACVAYAPLAAAERTNTPSGLSFEVPAGWTTTTVPAPGLTYLRSTDGAHECHFFGMLRPETALATPYRMRMVAKEPIADSVWQGMPPALRPVFHGPADFTGARVDETQFWPVQFGEYNAAGTPVHAAVQFRPGIEFWSFCLTRSGADDPAALTEIMRTVGSTNDAILQAAIETDEATREEHAQRRWERAQGDASREMDSLRSLRSVRPGTGLPAGGGGGASPGH